MKRKKVSIIGAGFVGSTAAHWICQKKLADVVLIDINGDFAKGKALDLYQSTPIEGADIHICGGSDYQLTQNSDLVIITAGSPRKEGMSRDDLLSINAKVITEVCKQIKNTSPQSTVIVVSNPLDAMTYQAFKTLGFEKNRVMGMAGILDTARFITFISEASGVSVNDIQTMVLGGHGDTMVPVLSQTFVGSQIISNVIPPAKIKELVQRTKTGGGELVQLLQKGSAYFAPSRGAVQMAEAILKDEKRVLPCTVLLDGEYGYSNIFIGVPCKLGSGGVEKIVEIPLTKDEKADFKKSVDSITANQKKLDAIIK